jgi:hypothetical protein
MVSAPIAHGGIIARQSSDGYLMVASRVVAMSAIDRTRTHVGHGGMSELCHERKSGALFDHLAKSGKSLIAARR